MPTPLEHDYIGLTESSSSSSSSSSLPPLMEIKSSDKISSSSPSSASSSSSPETHENEKNNNLKETELRLGLPGSQSPERKSSTELLLVSLFGKDLEVKHSNNIVNNKNVSESGVKRGFSDAIDVGSCRKWGSEAGSVLFSPKGMNNNNNNNNTGLKTTSSGANLLCGPTPTIKETVPNSSAPAAKAQVVGWPPIRSFRKNTMASNSAKNNEETEEKSATCCLYVKVSMDGAPYLRKVDLKTCKNYMELSSALEKMFGCFTIGKCGSTRVPERNGLTESRLMDLLHGSEFVVTYEDKDGDWMLVGDVPWEMFTGTCRRLRIMKGSEAIGLVPGAPRAMEKCMTRN